jgi:hypothetical protein
MVSLTLTPLLTICDTSDPALGDTHVMKVQEHLQNVLPAEGVRCEVRQCQRGGEWLAHPQVAEV